MSTDETEARGNLYIEREGRREGVDDASDMRARSCCWCWRSFAAAAWSMDGFFFGGFGWGE